MNSEFKRFSTTSDCHNSIARYLQQLIHEKLDKKGFFSLVLSGGRSPAELFQTLCTAPFDKKIPWDKVFFFWGDERCVPPDDPHSNFRLAKENLFNNLTIKPENIFRMQGECNFIDAAKLYEKCLNNFFNEKQNADTYQHIIDGYPVFDLIMLGMGPDGHTASLFPGHSALSETTWVVPVESENAVPQIPRISLTLPVINNSSAVLFMVSGKDKTSIVDSISNDEKSVRPYPAAMIKPREQLIWYLVE